MRDITHEGYHRPEVEDPASELKVGGPEGSVMIDQKALMGPIEIYRSELEYPVARSQGMGQGDTRQRKKVLEDLKGNNSPEVGPSQGILWQRCDRPEGHDGTQNMSAKEGRGKEDFKEPSAKWLNSMEGPVTMQVRYRRILSEG